MKYSKPMSVIADRLRGETSYHASTRHDLQTLTKQLEALEELAINKSPKDTDEAHLLKLEQAGKKLIDRRDRIKTAIEQRTRDAVLTIDGQIREALEMKATPFSNEIRSALRTMSPNDRRSAIQKAIASRDGGFFKAIEEAPAMLSGMDKQTQSEAVENYMRTHASDLMKQSDQVVEAFTSSMDALRIPKRAIEEGVNPRKLREETEAEQRHIEAQRSFDES